jgi:hypothetical protein
MTEQLVDEMAEFDSITDLSEAKRCLKITYRKYVNCHSGARFFMCVALVELGIIIAMALL